MSQSASARTTIRGTLRPTAVGLVVVTAAVIGTLTYQSASSSVHSFSPDGVTVFDDQYPGVANLDPDLLQALS